MGDSILTGKPYSAKLTLDEKTLQELRQKHGQDLEQWWQDRFGHTFDCLAQSETRYLARSRMLTPSELELLRKSQREIAVYAKEALKAA